ncbi:PLP-dependent aminotransferase family protein [Roseateles flavus]|uniref:PLP-dependent aminotransferase family protein n=1 Tax=Roseateles flavus TaxID=3149041 RepID=A0ABV0GGE1_9BURK
MGHFLAAATRFPAVRFDARHNGVMSLRSGSRFAADLASLPALDGESKQQWIYRQLATAIDNQLLKPGDAVPSTRSLAERWGVSRGVVELAFEQLSREGYVSAVVGRGTHVGLAPPERFLQADVQETSNDISPGRNRGGRSPPATATGQDGEAMPASAPVGAGQPFIARLPDVQTFGTRAWQACIAKASRALGPANLGDADPRGLADLREAICDHLALSRGLRCAPQEIMVVTGIRHAVDLCAQVAIGDGDAVALEDPGYSGAEAIFRLRGRRTVGIPVDQDGMDVSVLQQANVAMAYVTPAHQAPTGVLMSPARRKALLAWADSTSSWILEDDYDSDFSYERAPFSALKSQDRSDRVIFCGSFNKTLFPGLRVGYIVAPARLMPSLMAVRAATGRSNSVLDQLVLTEFMRTGALLRQLKTARVAYKTRRDLIIRELKASGFRDEDFQGLHAGFHFVLRLAPNAREDAMIALARESGMELQGLRSFWRGTGSAPQPGLVLGYTALTNAQAKWSARQLGIVLTSTASKHSLRPFE